MNLKYKKIILMVSMCTMSIGLITLSFSHNPKNSVKSQDTTATLGHKDKSLDTKGDFVTIDGVVEDGTLQENAYPEINELIKKYLDARIANDMDTISEIVSQTHSITLENLQRESEYIERYDNLSCYTIKGLEENSFIVYVYEELKIVGIDTLAPGMTRLYVKNNAEGNPIVYFGQVEDETSDFIEGTAKDTKVLKLIDRVNIKLEEAMTKDENLKIFIEGLETPSNTKESEPDATTIEKE